MTENPPTKTELRHALLARRQALDSITRAAWDAAIGNQASAWLKAHTVVTLGVYWPIRAEPDLRKFYATWAANGMQLCLPVVIDKNAPLKFYRWAPNDALVRDAMGVMVPANRRVELQPDAVLLPCVGFNAARLRLGYGGGFYDRTLATAPHPLALGVAYSCTYAAFAGEGHDIALDAIFTELETHASA